MDFHTDYRTLEQTDPVIAGLLNKELARQRSHLELIASENFVSPSILETMGSHLTNKYAEGYPGARFYGGCEVVDEVEKIAIDRCKQLFGCQHANVQPHSGSQANMAVFLAAIKPGDTVLGLNLSHGGHLTHGAKASMSGKYFHSEFYGVDPQTERIDYDEVARLARLHQPKLIIAGASAYARSIDFAKFRAIADEVGAYLMADIAHIAGLVAAGVHPSPVPYADFVTSTTHKTLRGPRGGLILCKAKHAKAIDSAVFPGIQGGPLMHTIAAKAVCFAEALGSDFTAYQQQVVRNGMALADALTHCGLRLVTGGTDNHLMLVDLTQTGQNGKEVQTLLGKAQITANRNTIPNETLSPSLASGIRFGTSALTTRGMKEEQMKRIAQMIFDVIENQEEAIPRVRAQVDELTAQFPLYQEGFVAGSAT